MVFIVAPRSKLVREASGRTESSVALSRIKFNILAFATTLVGEVIDWKSRAGRGGLIRLLV